MGSRAPRLARGGTPDIREAAACEALYEMPDHLYSSVSKLKAFSLCEGWSSLLILVLSVICL